MSKYWINHMNLFQALIATVLLREAYWIGLVILATVYDAVIV
jgi:hypothetical protein